MWRVGALIVLVTILAAVAGPWLVPYDPADQALADRLARPTLRHPFGLDELGRDVVSRVLAGRHLTGVWPFRMQPMR